MCKGGIRENLYRYSESCNNWAPNGLDEFETDEPAAPNFVKSTIDSMLDRQRMAKTCAWVDYNGKELRMGSISLCKATLIRIYRELCDSNEFTSCSISDIIKSLENCYTINNRDETTRVVLFNGLGIRCESRDDKITMLMTIRLLIRELSVRYKNEYVK